jgi:hypothetical protein
MTEICSTGDEEQEEFLDYMCYGDGAIFALVEREGEETILSRRKRDSVQEDYAEVVRKWIAYFYGSAEDGDHEPQGQSV